MEEVKYKYNSRHRKSRKYLLITIIVSVIIVVIAVTVIIMQNHKQSNNADSNTNSKTSNEISTEKKSEDVDSKTIKKIRILLDDYCESLFSQSFEASDYFADNVEQFISMKNTTAQSISNYINGSYREEFQEGQFLIENDLFDVTMLPNGGYEALFIESGSCYRKSKNKTQHTRVKVKALLNSDLKIYNWKEIEVLESRFEK